MVVSFEAKITRNALIEVVNNVKQMEMVKDCHACYMQLEQRDWKAAIAKITIEILDGLTAFDYLSLGMEIEKTCLVYAFKDETTKIELDN